MDLRSIGYDGEDIATVDQEKLKKWLKEIKEEVDEPAKDARMERWGAPIQPAEEGQRMDLKEIEENWLPHLSDYINEPQEIPFIAEKPRVTEKDLRAVNQRRIGRYTTYFDASNVNRTTNIRLSADAINNLVLNPGESFSFNRVVGQRTPERGYKPAAVIVRGEYSEGIGGGICQTSSTLYNSVDAAGLRVTVRYSHSKEVTYVPAGRDATVSWGGPDFRFMNSLEKPIMIKTYVGEGFITVSIYTTPDAKVVQRQVPPAPKFKAKQVEVDPDKPTDDASPASGSGQGGDSGNSSGYGGSSGNNGGNQTGAIHPETVTEDREPPAVTTGQTHPEQKGKPAPLERGRRFTLSGEFTPFRCDRGGEKNGAARQVGFPIGRQLVDSLSVAGGVPPPQSVAYEDAGKRGFRHLGL